MKIEIKFSCNNHAFGEPNSDQFGQEVGRILRECAEKFESGYARFPVRDVNGNTVGSAGLTSEE